MVSVLHRSELASLLNDRLDTSVGLSIQRQRGREVREADEYLTMELSGQKNP